MAGLFADMELRIHDPDSLFALADVICMMRAALDKHGHEWTTEERAALNLAEEVLMASVQWRGKK